MKTRVFVDGQEGTTGLQIHDRLQDREDLELLVIAPELRKDAEEKRRLLNAADVVFLCLPDAAAIESVALIENPETRVIDASTAHRTNPTWTYGLPELSRAQKAEIASARRIANPGCHATGFALAVAPLVQSGLVDQDAALSCFSVTGYSGGGKKLIATHETPDALHREAGSSGRLHAPRLYALGLAHKHLPEMMLVSGLRRAPHFNPIVGNFYQGMAVTVPLLPCALQRAISPKELQELLARHYEGQPFVRVAPFEPTPALDEGFLDPTTCNGTNRVDLHVFGNADHLQVTAVFDNLGKGASGAAIQNMNLLLGLDETKSLTR